MHRVLEARDVSTTAVLANYWKNEAKSKENWKKFCQEVGTREKDLFKDPLMSLLVMRLKRKQRVALIKECGSLWQSEQNFLGKQ